MSGRLQEISFSELEERQQSSQSSLNKFSDSDTTYVAVVSVPKGGIEEATDEVWHGLGMPQHTLKKFLARRDGYKGNSAVDDAHNTAYTDLGLTEIYHEHLENSSEAQERIRDATERVVSGENITLVCYESGGKMCHRHILIDRINEKIKSREACKFELSV